MKTLSIVLALWSSLLFAHDIEQVYVDLDITPEQTSGIMELDVELLLSKKSPDGNVDFSRNWLYRLGEKQHQEIQQEAITFINKSFLLELAGEPLAWEVSFPTYESQPYIFPVNFENSAIIDVVFTAKHEGKSGELKLGWEPFEAEPDPTLLLKLANQVEAIPINPQGDLVLGEVEGATVAVELSFGERLYSWVYEGFVHILPKGYDHILFILGLVLLSTGWQSLLKQSALFTIAHSITLFVATQGWFELPIKWVEVFIALSIVYVGVENVWLKEIRKQRYYLVFAFGLLHGLGFASVLGDILHQPEGGVLFPLLTFNIGVELGQIVVIILTLAVLYVLKLGKLDEMAKKYGSIGIALIAMLWTVCRIFEFEVTFF